MVEHSNAAASHDMWRHILERRAPEDDNVESWRLVPDGFAEQMLVSGRIPSATARSGVPTGRQGDLILAAIRDGDIAGRT